MRGTPDIISECSAARVPHLRPSTFHNTASATTGILARTVRRRCGSLQDLILECHAFGVIFLQPCFHGVDVCEHLEMTGVANMMSGIDINPNGCHWSLLSFGRPQCIPLRSVNVRST